MSEVLTMQPIDEKNPKYFNIVKATQHGNFDRCREIIEKDGYDSACVPDDENITVLHWAALNNRKELAEYYLSAGAVIDAIGGDLKSTPLHWAIRQGHQSMVALLMKHGADPMLADCDGCSAIHIAAKTNRWELVAYLVAKGIDIDIFDNNGKTPLMWAVSHTEELDIIRVLISLGADPNLADRGESGNTPLHIAIEAPNAIALQVLLEHVKDLNAENKNGATAISLADFNSAKSAEKLNAELDRRGAKRVNRLKRFFHTPAKRMGLMVFLALFCLTSVGLIANQTYGGNWQKDYMKKFNWLIILGLFMYSMIKTIIPSDEVSIKMPVCWSEATKAVIGLTVLFKVTPVIEGVFSKTINYLVFEPALLFQFFKIVTTDPGYISTRKRVQDSTIIDLVERDNLNSTTLCTTSLIRRPLRSKYCAISKRLVAKFDHFCPWVNNAVGARNHKDFLKYLALLIINLGWHAMAICKYWTSPNGCNVRWDESGAIMKCVRCSGWMTWIFVNDVLFLFWVFSLFVTQAYFIIKGVTTNEYLKAHRYPYLEVKNGQVIRNSFDRGIIQNFIDFTGVPLLGRKPSNIDWRTKIEYGPEFSPPKKFEMSSNKSCKC